MDPVVLFAARDLPQFGIIKGDRIVFDPATSPYPSLCRDLENVGAILGAFEAGELISLTRDASPSELRLAVGYDGQPPAPRSSSRLHLRLAR